MSNDQKIFVEKWLPLVVALASLLVNTAYIAYKAGILEQRVAANEATDISEHASFKAELSQIPKDYVTRPEWAAGQAQDSSGLKDLKDDIRQVNNKLDRLLERK